MSSLRTKASDFMLTLWALCLLGGIILVASMSLEDAYHFFKNYLTNK